jgi:hypothetical protein
MPHLSASDTIALCLGRMRGDPYDCPGEYVEACITLVAHGDEIDRRLLCTREEAEAWDRRLQRIVAERRAEMNDAGAQADLDQHLSRLHADLQDCAGAEQTDGEEAGEIGESVCRRDRLARGVIDLEAVSGN